MIVGARESGTRTMSVGATLFPPALFPPIHDAITVTDSKPVCKTCAAPVQGLGCAVCLSKIVVPEQK